MSQHYRYARTYVGSIRAVILDWSGTTVDKYVLAPAAVFVEVFKKHKVPISMKEARLPLGLRKDLHFKVITDIPEVRQRWKEVHGKYPDRSDVDKMFKDFIPMQLKCLQQYTELIPGTAKSVNILRKEFKVKIGSTTGLLRPMVDILLNEAKKQGYVPDATVAGDEVIHGTCPKPFMLYKNMDILDVHPIQSVIKVDDTVSGIREALEAGCWGVGVARYGNYMDIDYLEQETILSQKEIRRRVEKSCRLLRKAGAHYVIESVTDLPEVLHDINSRLLAGERP